MQFKTIRSTSSHRFFKIRKHFKSGIKNIVVLVNTIKKLASDGKQYNGISVSNTKSVKISVAQVCSYISSYYPFCMR